MSDNDIPANDLPDNDFGADPIDKAYVQAEAVLSDDDARAARRARVLGAVGREPAASSAASLRRPARRYGGWLAAACVAGLSVVVVSRTYQPITHPAQPAPAARTHEAQTHTAGTQAAGIQAASPRDGRGVAAPARASPPPQAAPAAPTVPRDDVAPASPAMRAPSIEPLRRAFPAAPAVVPSPPMLAPAPGEPAVTAERAAPPLEANAPRYSAAGAAADTQELARPRAGRPASAAPPSDRGASLRAAAAAGRITDAQALLDQGAPVDAPDADGDTALMKSIRADHPAVAGLLRRHGASLDRENRASESARDLATAKDDPALSRAIGLEP